MVLNYLFWWLISSKKSVNGKVKQNIFKKCLLLDAASEWLNARKCLITNKKVFATLSEFNFFLKLSQFNSSSPILIVFSVFSDFILQHFFLNFYAAVIIWMYTVPYMGSNRTVFWKLQERVRERGRTHIRIAREAQDLKRYVDEQKETIVQLKKDISRLKKKCGRQNHASSQQYRVT